MTLNIYYSKKHLKRSLAWHCFGLIVWVGFYLKIIFPLILNRQENVGEITHLVISVILTLIFAVYLAKLISILVGCISEYSNAPKIAYSLTKDGVNGSRKAEFISWDEIENVASMAKSDGVYLRKNLKSGFSINSWGISPDEMKKARGYIYQTLPENKTKQLNF